MSDTSYIHRAKIQTGREFTSKIDSAEQNMHQPWAMMHFDESAITMMVDGRSPSVRLKTLPERLAAVLVDIGEKHGGFIQNLDQQSLANQLGTHRETIAVLLRSYHRQGIIRISYKRIEIVNPEGLTELAP